MPVRKTRTRFYFNKHERGRVTRDYVNLTPGTSPIAVEHVIPRTLQKCDREIFAEPTEPTAWSVTTRLRHAREYGESDAAQRRSRSTLGTS